jgi:CheY-like chemotaxis protein
VTAAPVAAERPRVLVIDDDPAVGTVLARLLRADCDVTVVTGGADALRRLAAGERFDVLITDVMMPVMTGLELRDRLLATQPDQARRIVFITGGAFTAATAARLEQLDVPRLAKPVDADELRRAVRAMAAA